MENLLICLGLGVAVLFLAWYDYHREETGIYIFGFMLDISRDDYPRLYWASMLFQCIGGVFLIIYGLLHFKR